MTDNNKETPSTSSEAPKGAVLFSDLSDDNGFTEMESLCMNCHEQGVTRLLLTKIPFFKEIVVMAFSCPHCGFRSNEVQSGGSIAEKGCTFELSVKDKKDLNRQVVKSDTGFVHIPELDFEIPPITQRGSLNTVEGFIMQSVDALKQDQEERRKIDPETTSKIDAFIAKLEKLTEGNTPFTFIMTDVAGNSYIENPYAPADDPHMKTTFFRRTPEQNASIGLTDDETPEDQALKQVQSLSIKGIDDSDNNASGADKEREKKAKRAYAKYDLDFDKFDYKKQVMAFGGNCPDCHAPCETKMLAIDIPYFKEVIIMNTDCEACGYKSSEVKPGGGISEKGRRITLKVTDPKDLNRDFLKSETAVIRIPEKGLKVTRGTMGGRFTTLEGLLHGVKDDLFRANPFAAGDSSVDETRQNYQKFMRELDELISGNEKFTIIMEDPLANSYIQNPDAPDPDPNLTVEEYERTWNENEELGLNDIKTENY